MLDGLISRSEGHVCVFPMLPRVGPQSLLTIDYGMVLLGVEHFLDGGCCFCVRVVVVVGFFWGVMNAMYNESS